MTEEQLAVAYMDGDIKAFDALLERYESGLFSYILYIVHDEEVANDLFQDTFVKIIQCLQRRQYVPTGSFHGWCMRLAHNVVMDWFRNNRQERHVDVGEDNDLTKMKGCYVMDDCRELEMVNLQVLHDVKRLVDALPSSQREVVEMRFYKQMSFKEIAASTDVSINTALGRMRYALINMRKMARDNDIYLQME